MAKDNNLLLFDGNGLLCFGRFKATVRVKRWSKAAKDECQQIQTLLTLGFTTVM